MVNNGKMGLVENFRNYRTKKLEKIARAVAQTGLRANHITFLSLLCGILAAYFLFSKYYLFVLFVILHLCLDGFDGVVARVTKPTPYGKYFDLVTDSSVTFLLLLNTAAYLQELYAFLAAGLFMLALIIHIKGKLQTPMLFLRTSAVAVLVVAVHPLFPYQQILLTLGYLAAGGVSLFSLARQLQWYVGKK